MILVNRLSSHLSPSFLGGKKEIETKKASIASNII